MGHADDLPSTGGRQVTVPDKDQAGGGLGSSSVQRTFRWYIVDHVRFQWRRRGNGADLDHERQREVRRHVMRSEGWEPRSRQGKWPKESSLTTFHQCTAQCASRWYGIVFCSISILRPLYDRYIYHKIVARRMLAASTSEAVSYNEGVRICRKCVRMRD
jgi:hypothetical protein